MAIILLIGMAAILHIVLFYILNAEPTADISPAQEALVGVYVLCVAVALVSTIVTYALTTVPTSILLALMAFSLVVVIFR